MTPSECFIAGIDLKRQFRSYRQVENQTILIIFNRIGEKHTIPILADIVDFISTTLTDSYAIKTKASARHYWFIALCYVYFLRSYGRF